MICIGTHDVDWRRITEEAVRILTCAVCTAGSADALPQPFWVGEAYRPGGVVLVARNPASKQLPEEARRLLERLRDEQSPAAFTAWSRWRITHMTGKPWTQWQRAFAKAVAGCWQPHQLAWLNVVPAATVADAAPPPELIAHGHRDHLAPMLTEVLRPAAVVTRYAAATRAVRSIPGPWHQDRLFALNGRTASNLDTSTISRTLREHGLCEDNPEPARPTMPPPLAHARSEPAAGSGHGLHGLRERLVAALAATSGYPAQIGRSYTSVGDAPIWAFVEQRADAVQVKFRVAPPYRTARSISSQLVEAGMASHVGDVRAAPGSTRLWVRLRGPGDLAALQRELPALWRDYGRLR